MHRCIVGANAAEVRRGADVQRFRGAVVGCRGVQRCSGVQRCRCGGADVQRWTVVERFRCSEVQRCRGAEVQVQVQVQV